MKKYVDLVLSTFLSWFDNKVFTFVFALVLAVVAFFCADPVDGVPAVNIALFAFLVGIMIYAVTKGGYSLSGVSFVNTLSCPSR